MTRINSAITVRRLTDEHLLEEHREIKRLPDYLRKAISSGSVNRIPEKFTLGPGHVLFFIDKQKFLYERYLSLYDECIDRGFNVTYYADNWDNLMDGEYWRDHQPTLYEFKLLSERISDRIKSSSKPYFHYRGFKTPKTVAIDLVNVH